MTLFEQEIAGQADAVARFLESQTEAAHRLAARVDPANVGWVMIAARGSSDNAARYGQYLLGIRNRLPVALAAPSLFTIYASPPRLGRTLVIGISQSGEAPDVLAVVEESRRQGCPTLAITASGSSPLGRAAEHVLELGVRERAVAATMTYTTSLAALALLSACWSGSEDALRQLREVPSAMTLTLAEARARSETMHPIPAAAEWVVIGRGYSYTTAFETALKLKEVAGAAVEPYSSTDFLHGPVAAVGPETVVLLIAPEGEALTGLQELHSLLARRGARVITVSNHDALVRAADVGFPLPPVAEWLSPLAAVIPGQLLALHLALEHGLDPDRPRGLDKVTRTR